MTSKDLNGYRKASTIDDANCVFDQFRDEYHEIRE